MDGAGHAGGGEVVAEQTPAGSQDPGELTEGVLPVDDVVEHEEADGGVEAVVVEGKSGGVGLFHGDPGPEMRHSAACGGDHGWVDVGRGDGGGRLGSGEHGGVGARARSNLEDVSGQVLAAEHPWGDDPGGEATPRRTATERRFDLRHHRHRLDLTNILNSTTGSIITGRYHR